MKALDLMKSNRTLNERAESYVKSIQRDIQKKVLDVLIERDEKITDELFELTNFSLEADLNKGLKPMTKEECEKRFIRIIELEFEQEMVRRELKIKQATFNKFFSNDDTNETKA